MLGGSYMHLNLFVARKEKRMSQREIAELIGTHPQTYHMKETGKRDFLLDEALTIASFFGQKVEELFNKAEVRS